MIHRDIKPENVLLEGKHAMVADFGVARALSEAGGEHLTRTGIVVGTSAYMSPEQATGAEVGPSSDLYSLACVTYEMLAGEPPFTGPNDRAVVARHLTDPVPPLTTVRPTIPPGVDRAIQIALSKVPADRFDGVAAFAEALATRSVGVEGGGQKWRRRVATTSWTGRRFAILLPVAVALAGGLWWLGGTADEAPLSIAILPCENLSPDPDDGYLAASIHQEVLSRLQRLPSLRSIGRTSVLRYAERPQPLAEIATDLGVEYVGECSLRKDPARDLIRLAFNLTEAATGREVWGQSYDRIVAAEGGLLDVQADIAGNVVAALGTALTPDLESRVLDRATTSDQAYDEYLRGLEQLETRTPEGFEASEIHFRRAINLDADFAPAYARLADSYSFRYIWVGQVDDLVFPLAWEAAQRALELEPGLAEAHSAFAFCLLLGGPSFDPVRAEVAAREAVRLAPSDGDMHNILAITLTMLGRHDEAATADARALRLDPLSGFLNISVGYRLFWANRTDEADAALRHTLELVPEGPVAAFAQVSRGMMLASTDRVDAAAEAFVRTGELLGIDPSVAAGLADSIRDYRLTGRPHATPVEFGADSGFSPFLRARLAALLGDRTTALELLDSSGSIAYVTAFPFDAMLASLHDDPRFLALMEKWFGADWVRMQMGA